MKLIFSMQPKHKICGGVYFFFEGGQVTLIFSFIFYLVRLWLGCIPKISFLACLEVPQKFVWVVVGGGGGGGGWWLRVNLVIALA